MLAHGFGGDQSVWDSYVPWLAQRYRVIQYDLACAGTADPDFFRVPRHQTLDGHVEDLVDLLRELDVRRCTFVGHSVSGMLGVLTATRRPDLFEKLILIGASARYLNDEGYEGGFDHAAIVSILSAIRANYHDWARSFGPLAIGAPPEHPASETFVASLLRMRPDVAVVMANAFFFSDHRATLGKCGVPAIVLQTREDVAVPLAAAEYLQRHIPVATLDMIEAKGHLPHLSAPAAMEAALRRHLPRFKGALHAVAQAGP